MVRIEQAFHAFKDVPQAARVALLIAGDPDMDWSVGLLRCLSFHVDIIEFAQPCHAIVGSAAMQAAVHRGQAQDVTLSDVLALARIFRADNPRPPLVLHCDTRQAQRMGWPRFAEQVARCGFDGVHIADISIADMQLLQPMLRAERVHLIGAVSRRMTASMIAQICALSSGYLRYYEPFDEALGTDAVLLPLVQIRQACRLPIARQGAGAESGDAQVIDSGIASVLAAAQNQATALSALRQLLQGDRVLG